MVISPPNPGNLSVIRKILIVDDEEDEFIIARGMLKLARGCKFDVHWASTYAAGQEELIQHPYDVVLVDYELGLHSGIELIREANERGYASPLILYTGHGSYEVDVEAMQAGATLYLTKGEFSPLLLERAIRYAIEMKSKEHVLREREEQLQKTSEALRESEQKYLAVFKTAAFAIALVRMEDEVIVDANPAWSKLFGVEREQAVGRTALELGLVTDPEAGALAYAELKRHGSLRNNEMVSRTRTGAWVVTSNNIDVIEINGTKYLLSTLEDITARKQAETALQEANELLEKRVEERTRELKNAQEELRQRNAELEHALAKEKALRIQLIQAEKNAALARLIASVAHEINNPLQTVKNSLFLLKMDLSSPDAPDVLEMAYTESQRIGNLVQQLRETYRPSELKVVDFNLCDVLLKVKRLLEPQFHQNHVKWSLENPLDCIPIHGIPDRIQQVFLNICLNAVDAMSSKGGNLQVRVTQDGRNVRIIFQDSGPGISPEDIDQLFEPFFTTKEKGTGLGLVISYEIIRDHHGEIFVDSVPGQGATFTVSLPMKVAYDGELTLAGKSEG